MLYKHKDFRVFLAPLYNALNYITGVNTFYILTFFIHK